MDGIIIIAAFILNPRAEKRRREGQGITLTLETPMETTDSTNIQVLNPTPVSYIPPTP